MITPCILQLFFFPFLSKGGFEHSLSGKVLMEKEMFKFQNSHYK